MVVIHGNENGERIFEKFLKTDNLSIFYESDGDTPVIVERQGPLHAEGMILPRA